MSRLPRQRCTESRSCVAWEVLLGGVAEFPTMSGLTGLVSRTTLPYPLPWRRCVLCARRGGGGALVLRDARRAIVPRKIDSKRRPAAGRGLQLDGGIQQLAQALHNGQSDPFASHEGSGRHGRLGCEDLIDRALARCATPGQCL